MNALDNHYARYDADLGNWPQPQDTCNACHGTSGQSQNEQYPSLVGQKADYLQAQLHAFAEGKRHSAQMEPLAATLTDDQIVSLAQYFARQMPLSTDISTADEQLSAKGKVSAAERGCSACHGSDFVGGAVGPRLAGQGKAYLLSQLLAFKEGTRTDPSGDERDCRSAFANRGAGAGALPRRSRPRQALNLRRADAQPPPHVPWLDQAGFTRLPHGLEFKHNRRCVKVGSGLHCSKTKTIT